MEIRNKRVCYEILEIEATNDLKVIKRAYARMIRKYHPEVDPEKYEQVRAAYEFLHSLYSSKDNLLLRFDEKDNISGINFRNKSSFFPFESEERDEFETEREEVKNVFNFGEEECKPKKKPRKIKNEFNYGNEANPDYIKKIGRAKDEEEDDDPFANEVKRLASFDIKPPQSVAESAKSEYNRFRDMYALLKKLAIPDYYKGRVIGKILSRVVFERLRSYGSEYFAALGSKTFVATLTSELSNVGIESDLADILLEDIEKVKNKEEYYQRLIDLIEKNRIPVKKVKKKKPKKESRIPKFFRVWILASLVISSGMVVLYLLPSSFRSDRDIGTVFAFIFGGVISGLIIAWIVTSDKFHRKWDR